MQALGSEHVFHASARAGRWICNDASDRLPASITSSLGGGRHTLNQDSDGAEDKGKPYRVPVLCPWGSWDTAGGKEWGREKLAQLRFMGPWCAGGRLIARSGDYTKPQENRCGVCGTSNCSKTLTTPSTCTCVLGTGQSRERTHMVLEVRKVVWAGV